MADHEEPGPTPDGASGGAARRVGSAGAVAVTFIAAVTLNACAPSPDGDRAPHAQQPKQGAACGLRVVESAVDRQDHYLASVRDLDGDRFLASAIVENPCRRAATNATFAVSPLDGHGRELLSAGRPVQDHFTIALILPGQRAAGWTYFTRQEAPSGVANLRVQREVRFGGTCWADPAAYRTTARATDVAVGKRDTSRSVTNGEADVSFTVTWSPPDSALGRRSASVIFRDASGRLLDANGQSIGADVRRGKRKHFVTWVPARADLARTEVMLQPEPDPQGTPNSPSPSCLASPDGRH